MKPTPTDNPTAGALRAAQTNLAALQETNAQLESELTASKQNAAKIMDGNHRQIGVIQKLRAQVEDLEDTVKRLTNALRVAEMPLQISLDEEEWRQAHPPEEGFNPDDRHVRRFALEAVRAALTKASQGATKGGQGSQSAASVPPATETGGRL